MSNTLENAPTSSRENPEALRKQVLSLMVNLPAMRGIYYQVVQELNDPSSSIDTVSRLIATDPVMTGKVLQLANSAALGFQRRYHSPNEAVFALGGEKVKSIILFVEAFSICSGIRVKNFSPEKLWRHSTQVASAAQKIMATQSGSQSDHDAAYTAGLLHDIGKLLLVRNVPIRYLKALDGAKSARSESALFAERKEFGVTHADVGAIVLESWDLPTVIVNAVGKHHDPSCLSDGSFGVHDAVAVANWSVHRNDGPSGESTDDDAMSIRIQELWDESTLGEWA